MASTSDLLVLSASDVTQITASFSPTELQCLMAQVFLSLTRQRHSLEHEAASSSLETQSPHRTTVSMRNHKALWMPARFCPVSDPGNASTSMKIVCVPQAARGEGLPASTIVLDEDTGCVKAVVNATKLTALRNAAGSLLATCLTASRYPRHVVVFGAGAQIEAHLNLFLGSFTRVESCTIVNRTLNQRAKDLATSLKKDHSEIRFQLVTPPEESRGVENAVRQADLVICATSATQPLFPSAWVRDGTHLVLIGSYTPEMKEVDVELVRRAVSSPHRDSLLVDSKESCMAEAGELLDAKVSMEEMTEIGEVTPSLSDGRLDLRCLEGCFQRARELPWQGEPSGYAGVVTIFKSVGVGLQDVAIAKAVVERAESTGLGQRVVDYH